MQSTMMRLPLSLNHLLERAGTLFPGSQIVSRLPDKSLRRHSYAAFYARARALGAALRRLGLEKDDRVATLLWNHHAHLECYFGIPAAAGVMHTLNLRLAPGDTGWIAAHAGDRFLIVDDVLLPLYRQFAALHRFERVIVFPFSGAPVERGFDDYESLLELDAAFEYAPHGEDDAIAMCYNERHDRQAERRRLFTPLDGPAFAGREPARLLGTRGSRLRARSHADVPRELLGHSVWRGDARREARLSRSAPAAGRSARSHAG